MTSLILNSIVATMLLAASPNPQDESSEAVGRYQMAQAGDVFVMIDTTNGDAWILRHESGDRTQLSWEAIPRPRRTNRDRQEGQPREGELEWPLAVSNFYDRIGQLEADLIPIKIELAELRLKFGEGHPTIRQASVREQAIQSVIDSETERFIETIDHQLAGLRSRLAQVSEIYGTNHPNRIEVDMQIEFWESVKRSVGDGSFGEE